MVKIPLIHRALPIPFPLAANRVRHRQPKRLTCQFSIAFATMIFEPRYMTGMLMQVMRAYMVVLAANHPAQAGEEAFGLVR
ncbi:hypothetical protein BKI51_07170 [Alphaproteobacteria bacterium AO1-B]|nr:hypothetical protein BKI51_07170 [Alphaproteobacteria bacterium AO1-B]